MSELVKRLCPCAINIDDEHGYGCEVSGDACIFLVPTAKRCAELMQEGPEVGNKKEEKDA